jgi:hypothetical protein
MTIAEAKTKATDMATETADSVGEAGTEMLDETRSTAGQIRDAMGDVMDRVPVVLEAARSGVGQVADQMPAAVERGRIGAVRTTTSLQAMPDTTLRLIAGASIGLAAGLTLAGAPRLVSLVALVPAIFVGGAEATRQGRQPSS